MNTARRYLDKTMKVDWFFLILVLALMCCGVVLVYSATYNPEEAFYQSYWFRQIIYFIVGSFIAAVLAFIRIDYLKRLAMPFYVLSLVGLIVVLFGGGDVVIGIIVFLIIYLIYIST